MVVHVHIVTLDYNKIKDMLAHINTCIFIIGLAVALVKQRICLMSWKQLDVRDIRKTAMLEAEVDIPEEDGALRAVDDQEVPVLLQLSNCGYPLDVPLEVIADQDVPMEHNVHRDDPGDPTKMDLRHPGYSFCWDNIQKLVRVRHATKDKGNKFKLWAMTYAVENRIPYTPAPAPNVGNMLLRHAADIPLFSFLPSPDDFNRLRSRMLIIVKRILCECDPVFKDLNHLALDQVPHEHMVEMAQKSEVVNIGVLNENPSSIAGVIAIMEALQKYAPVHNGQPVRTIPVHGDGLSVERMIDAKRARAVGLTPVSRLETLEPVPQEFHKRGLLIQDAWDSLLCDRSAGSRGSLKHAQHVFRRKGVTPKVMECFNHASDFFRMVTKGNICLLHKELSDGEDVQIPESEEDRISLLDRTAMAIVNEVWSTPRQIHIDDVIDAPDRREPFLYCYCQTERPEEEMVQCSSTRCETRWFHYQCVDVDEQPVGDWWCSAECRSASIHCLCRLNKDDQKIQCAAKHRCDRGEYFHYACVHLHQAPDGDWFCSKRCRVLHANVDQEPDYMHNYSVDSLWRGLNDLALRDCIREGDGDAMISMWRINMLQFWQHGHNKYLRNGHRLLAGQEGWLSSEVAHVIRWNRTINIRGGNGANIEMDLWNEFLNNDFVDNLRSSRGQYSDEHVQRISMMVGTLSRDLDRVFAKNIANTYFHEGRQQNFDSQLEDVQSYITEYEDDHLFATIPGRQLVGRERYMSKLLEINRPQAFKARLKLYARNLDRQRRWIPAANI